MNMTQDYLLGFDVGSSSIKVSLLGVDDGQMAGSATAPGQEMPITSQQAGWAAQHPDLWWTHLVTATQQVMDLSGLKPGSIQAKSGRASWRERRWRRGTGGRRGGDA